MRIAVAQTRPVTGNVQKNIESHVQLTGLALSQDADLIVFPELSLTGYEPALADKLACLPEDERLEIFRRISSERKATLGVGLPLRDAAGVHISMILFQPGARKQIYSKKYLHPDEEPYFTPGENYSGLVVNGNKIALAICYEISISEHTESVLKNGSGVYIASVAKFVNGIDKAMNKLSETAASNSVTVLMSNCVGYCDGGQCAGKTSVWMETGALAGQLDDQHEGVLLFDTDTGEVIRKSV